MLLLDPASAKFDKKFIDFPGMLKWLDEHRIDVMRYLDSRFTNEEDKDINFWRFVNDPRLGYLLVNDTMMSEGYKRKRITNYVVNTPCVIPVLGKKGGGKTTLAGWMSDLMHEAKISVCWFNVNYSDELPKYIQLVNNWDEVPDGSLVVVDEAGLTANNKEFMTRESRDMGKLLMISRHHNLRILFNYQSMYSILADVYRMADAFMVKPLQFTDTMSEDERTKFSIFKFMVQMQPRSVNQCLFTNGEEWFTFTHRKPEWWTEDISRGFSRKTIDKTVQIIYNAYKVGATTRMLISKAKSLGYDWDKYEIQLLCQNPKKFAKAYAE
jgi:energy-coupling factor transporter ATP-binding protein EcfA2